MLAMEEEKSLDLDSSKKVSQVTGNLSAELSLNKAVTRACRFRKSTLFFFLTLSLLYKFFHSHVEARNQADYRD